MIETWLPLLSHQGDSLDNWGASSTSGISPVKRGLYWVALGISSTFVVVVIPFTLPDVVTISVGSDRT